MDLRSKDAIESSKQHDIKIGNILIAEFMEVHEIMHDEYSEYDFADNTLDVVHENELKYHLSWDWLMPVVQKCRQENRLDYFDRVYYALEECDINITYKAVVEFIKNQNN
jgi:hypothetical protein